MYDFRKKDSKLDVNGPDKADKIIDKVFSRFNIHTYWFVSDEVFYILLKNPIDQFKPMAVYQRYGKTEFYQYQFNFREVKSKDYAKKIMEVP